MCLNTLNARKGITTLYHLRLRQTVGELGLNTLNARKGITTQRLSWLAENGAHRLNTLNARKGITTLAFLLSAMNSISV